MLAVGKVVKGGRRLIVVTAEVFAVTGAERASIALLRARWRQPTPRAPITPHREGELRGSRLNPPTTATTGAQRPRFRRRRRQAQPARVSLPPRRRGDEGTVAAPRRAPPARLQGDRRRLAHHQGRHGVIDRQAGAIGNRGHAVPSSVSGPRPRATSATKGNNNSGAASGPRLGGATITAAPRSAKAAPVASGHSAMAAVHTGLAARCPIARGLALANQQQAGQAAQPSSPGGAASGPPCGVLGDAQASPTPRTAARARAVTALKSVRSDGRRSQGAVGVNPAIGVGGHKSAGRARSRTCKSANGRTAGRSEWRRKMTAWRAACRWRRNRRRWCCHDFHHRGRRFAPGERYGDIPDGRVENRPPARRPARPPARGRRRPRRGRGRAVAHNRR